MPGFTERGLRFTARFSVSGSRRSFIANRPTYCDLELSWSIVTPDAKAVNYTTIFSMRPENVITGGVSSGRPRALVALNFEPILLAVPRTSDEMTKELPAKARIALLRQAVRTQPQSALLLCELSETLASAGQEREAAGSFRRAYLLEPSICTKALTSAEFADAGR